MERKIEEMTVKIVANGVALNETEWRARKRFNCVYVFTDSVETHAAAAEKAREEDIKNNYFTALKKVKELPVEDRQSARIAIVARAVQAAAAAAEKAREDLAAAQGNLASVKVNCKSIRAKRDDSAAEKARKRKARNDLKKSAKQAIKTAKLVLEEKESVLFWLEVDLIGYKNGLEGAFNALETGKGNLHEQAKLNESIMNIITGAARHAVNSRLVAVNSARKNAQKGDRFDKDGNIITANAGYDTEIKDILDQFSCRPLGEKAGNLVQAAAADVWEHYLDSDETPLFLVAMRATWKEMDKNRVQKRDKNTNKLTYVKFIPAEWQDEEGNIHHAADEIENRVNGNRNFSKPVEDKAISHIYRDEMLSTMDKYSDIISNYANAAAAIKALQEGKSLRTLAKEEGKSNVQYTKALERLKKTFRKLDNADFYEHGRAGHRERDLLNFLDFCKVAI